MRQTTLNPVETYQKGCPKLSHPDNACVPFCDLMGGFECHKFGGPLRSECPKCGYVNIPGLVICWSCGQCLDPRLEKLAEVS